MHILLFVLYGIVLGWLLTRLRFFRDSGIKPFFLLLFFGLHVIAGCIQNWMAWHFFPAHGDVWALFDASFITRRELTTDFHLFIAHNSRLVDLPHNVLTILVMSLNVLSFDNLYIDTLLFGFVIFCGSFALFRAFRTYFPDDSLTALSTLLFPSTLFWTSCIYTEGVIYALTGCLLYLIAENSGVGGGFRKGTACFLLFLLAAFFRLSALVTLLPSLITWALVSKHEHRSRYLRGAGFGVLLLAMIIAASSGGLANLTGAVIDKQHQFQILQGASRIYLPVLENSWSSFILVLPWALRNGFFEPLPGSGGKAMYLLFAFELIVIWGIVLIALAKKLANRPNQPSHPGHQARYNLGAFTCYCLFYAFSGMLLIGLIVPFIGAIVRYRSIFLPFLLAPFLHSLRFSTSVKKINRKLNKYIYSSGQ